MKRVGILGGTFDPIHIGHLFIAEEVYAALKLEKVYFVPAGEPPHKLDEHVTPIRHRVAMVKAAIADNAHFALSLIDANRQGPSYSIDMVRLFRQTGQGDCKVYFIMGIDSLLDLPHWHRPEVLMRLCELVVVTRPGYRQNLEDLGRALPGLGERVQFIHSPGMDVSSSDIQRRVHNGQPIRYLVPIGVEQYIREHGLYKSSGGEK
ncbi:MAG: nicotinate-nucleotide adenylyltransferase [Chloroflexi bacterium]|nr:nicotinate-nucleotide adenylyltransferase [Chloroflexota bacterium]